MDRRKRRERCFNRMADKASVLFAIAAMIPRAVFSELHGYTLSKKPDKPDKAFYWARFMFRDIYGVFPRDEDLVNRRTRRVRCWNGFQQYDRRRAKNESRGCWGPKGL
jgi:hypothetical protein